MKVDLTEAIGDIFVGDTLRRFCMILDADAVYIRQAIPTMVTMIVDAISEKASTVAGATAMLRVLEDYDGKVLETIPHYFKDLSALEQSSRILPRLMGDKLPKSMHKIAKIIHMEEEDAQKALALITPLILHHIGRDVQKYNLDSHRLVEYLSLERAEIRATKPGLIGIIRRYFLKYGLFIKRRLVSY